MLFVWCGAYCINCANVQVKFSFFFFVEIQSNSFHWCVIHIRTYVSCAGSSFHFISYAKMIIICCCIHAGRIYVNHVYLLLIVTNYTQAPICPSTYFQYRHARVHAAHFEPFVFYLVSLCKVVKTLL